MLGQLNKHLLVPVYANVCAKGLEEYIVWFALGQFVTQVLKKSSPK